MNNSPDKTPELKKLCLICSRPARSSRANYCADCVMVVKRVGYYGRNERSQRLNAIRNSLKDDVFRCHYTGIELELQNTASPFYFTFDHIIPRYKGKFVACAAFVNDMKIDSTEEEFKHNIKVLAKHFESGMPLSKADFKLNHYKRHKYNK